MVKFYVDPTLTLILLTVLLTIASAVLWRLMDRSWRKVGKVLALGCVWLVGTAAVIQSGASTDVWTIDATSKAGRASLYDSAGRETSIQSKQTFACSGTFTPAATPTDMVKLVGSATKTVRVISMYFATTNTAAGSQQYAVIKRSADDTTGTFVAGTIVPLDANDAAGTASCGHYTANPGALGTSLGTINTMRVASPVAIPATFAGIVQDAGFELLPWMDRSLVDQPVTLRGIAQILAVNFAGAALVAGQTHAYRVVWIEE